eukprot:TRINITY_DN3657_c0_g1_i2.p1 TRINITY_DN3657_c0_g1~~TRINITY_DN3657_c0_g1_i2.p1  ORF type:complete len:372 (+),score=34.40 TRINITY_DN3657_c0_g1_i2:154-1116(+)
MAAEMDVNLFNGQDVSNILWSMATIGHTDSRTISHFARLARLHVQSLSPQGIANVLWALKKLRHYEQHLMAQIEKRIMDIDVVLPNSCTSMVAMALADLGCQDSRVMEKLVDQFCSSYRGYTQHISNITYALSVMKCPLKLTQSVADRLQEEEVSRFRRRELVQLRRAQLWYQSDRAYGRKLLNYPKEIEKQAFQAIKQETLAKLQFKNWFLDNVFLEVQKGFGAQNVKARVPVCDDQLVVHVQVEMNNQKVAVQTLTRAAYTSSQPIQLMGTAKAYLKVLERLGWKVVEVSAFEWYRDQYKFETMERINEALGQSRFEV